jgi:hypothetical protein
VVAGIGATPFAQVSGIRTLRAWASIISASPREIRERCLEIQASWSANERLKRKQQFPIGRRIASVEEHWTVPTIPVVEVAANSRPDPLADA